MLIPKARLLCSKRFGTLSRPKLSMAVVQV